MFLGGLDIGTTGCKITVYNTEGEHIANAYREYPKNNSDGREIDSGMIWESVCEIMKEIASTVPDLAGIGVTSFGESFALLDEKDQILLPTMLYTDPRGSEEIADLVEKVGQDRLIEITGNKPHSMYSIAKLMWIKRNRPEIYAKAKHVCLIADLIVYLLTGEAVIDYSLAARTAAFDIRKLCFSEEVLEAAGIDPALFSKPVKMGYCAGPVKQTLLDRFGFSSQVKIVVGGHDQISSALGAGVFAVGEAVDGTGTVECITPIFEGIPENRDLYEHNYSVIPFLYDGIYVCYAFSYTGGASLKWYRDTFCPGIDYAELNTTLPDEPTGILVLPHFAGAATPYMDTGSKAAFVGVTLETGKGDLYKAIMEGVTYEIRLNLEQLNRNGIRPTCLKATGGGAKSPEWLQIKADILGLPIIAIDAMEAGACGNCMMVGVSLGMFDNFQQASEKFVAEKKTYYPNPERQKQYDELYRRYQDLYRAVRPLV